MPVQKLLFLALVGIGNIGSLFGESASQQMFVGRYTVEEAFPWIKQGQLIYCRVEGDLLPHGSVSYYRAKGSDTGLALNGSLSAMSDVVVREGAAVDGEFLRRQIPLFLVFLTAQPHSRVLNGEYAKEVRASKSLLPAMKQSIITLCREPIVELERNAWKLSFAVVNGDGSASVWHVEGGRNPFSFIQISIRSLKERGALAFSVDEPG